MKKIVISGSSQLQDKINLWLSYFHENNYEILDYPRPIEEDKFMELYPNIHYNEIELWLKLGWIKIYQKN